MVHAGGECLEVLGRRGGGLDVGAVVLIQEADGVLVRCLVDVGSWAGVLGAQCAGFVGVGAPAFCRFVVDGDGDLGDGFAVSQERGAAEGFIAGESDGNEVQAGLGQGDASVGGDVQDGPGNAGPWSGDHDGGGRATGLGVDEVEELLERGTGCRCVDQEHPGVPCVSAGLTGAGGRDVGVDVVGAVDRGNGVGEELFDGV